MNLASNIGKIGASIWVIWVVISYLLFQPDTTNAIASIPYWSTILILAVFVLGVHFLLKIKNQVFNWRGLYWLPLIMIISSVIIPSFYEVAERSAGSYALKVFYFSIFSGVLLTVLVLIFSSAWSLGSWLLAKTHISLEGDSPFIQLAFGLSVLGFSGTILGLAGFFNQITVGALFLLPIIINWKNWIRFIQNVIWARKKVKMQNIWHWPLFAAFATGVSISWIGAIKAFPTGNDGASLYVGLAHKLAQLGQLPTGEQAYAWSVFMGFGEALSSSVTLSILLSHSMGLVAMAALYHISRKWLSSFWSLLVITIVFLSPYFAFHSIIDEKVDLALLFFVLALVDLITTKSIIKALREPVLQRSTLSTVLLIGWISGFAFSIKYASVIFILPLIVLLVYQKNMKQAYGLFLMILGIFYKLGSSVMGIGTSDPLMTWLTSILIFATGLVIVLYKSTTRPPIQKLFTTYLIFFIGFIIPFSPWGIKHSMENGSISVESILEGKREAPTLITNPFLIGYEEDSNLNISPLWPSYEAKAKFMTDQGEADSETVEDDPKSSINAQYEELQRYMGFEPGVWRNLSLPTDLTYSINVVGNRYVVIGFLFLSLLPFCFFVRSNLKWNLSLSIVSFLVLCFSLVSINDFNASTRAADEILLLKDLNGRQPDGLRELFSSLNNVIIDPLYTIGQGLKPVYDLGRSLDQGLSLFLLLCLLSILFFFSKSNFKTWPQELKLLTFMTTCGGVTWWAFGLGVVWYGLFIFALIPLILVFVLVKSNKTTSIMSVLFYRQLWKIMLTLHVGITLLLYFTNPRVNGPQVELFAWPDLEYATEPNHSQQDVLKDYNQYLPQAIKRLNEDTKSKIYLINTQMGYHIDNYDRRVFEDDLLANYGKETSKYGQSLDYYRALGLNGYKYVLFDLNTPTMDKTPEQSLAKRCQKFVGGILRSPHAELVLTDNLIYDENAPMVTLPNGQRTKAKPGMLGQMLKKGSFALFQLKVADE